MYFPKYESREVPLRDPLFPSVCAFFFLSLSSLSPSLFSPLVSDNGLVRGVDHCGVVDCGEISVNQVKLVHAQ